MKDITTTGTDLAKNVLTVHGVVKQGKPALKRQLKHKQVAAFFASLPACRVGMEACGEAHHRARMMEKLGHVSKLIALQFVKLCVKTSKYDAADSEAIC